MHETHKFKMVFECHLIVLKKQRKFEQIYLICICTNVKKKILLTFSDNNDIKNAHKNAFNSHSTRDINVMSENVGSDFC